MNTLFKRLFTRTIKHGSLSVVDLDGSVHTFGDGDGFPFRIAFRDPDVSRAMLSDPGLSFGETYMDGRWVVEHGTLAGLLEMLMLNTDAAPPSPVLGAVRKILRGIVQDNTRQAARRNAQHHYDVGNDIYRLFLDDDWQYSCAYFSSPNLTLEEAQKAKKRHIAAKLLLEEGQRVLDIGCGWGGMALYLADHAGVDVTGITLADNQVAYASERAAGRPNLHFRIEDYRAVEDRFDRIVSVGMFEHVGAPYFDEYFAHCQRLLADDGVMLLHSIGRNHGPGSTNPFIQKYIFPGGYIPALSEVIPAIERAGLFVTDVEILRLHYADTLKHWRERFVASRDRVLALKDERFFRMWDFYLAGSEASFRTGDMMVFQIQLAKSPATVPLTRDYMMTTETALAARDGDRAAPPARVARQG